MGAMNKYKVSLAMNIPGNFEAEVEGSDKKEALEKALKKYRDGDFEGDDVSLDFANAEMNIDEEKKIDDLGNGIWIEEI